MQRGKLFLVGAWAGLLILVGGYAAAQTTPTGQSPQAARAMGAVTQIQAGHLTLRADNGSEVQVQLPEDVAVLRVPPGAKDLKSATKITVGDIGMGDRVLVIGRPGEAPSSLLATRVVVMTKSDLASAHEAEARDWQRRGISGVVKAVDPTKKEISIAVPNTPPTPGNPTHLVSLGVTPDSKLLRYAPDSVKFSDAKPSTFEAINVGDQVRALGTKSEDGGRFATEKLVSGSFRNIGATVISVDLKAGEVTVKDLGSGKSLVVHATADSKIHQLPPQMAEMIARLNSGAGPAGGAGAEAAPPGAPRTPNGFAGAGGAHRGGMGNFNQMLEQMPILALTELKPGEPLIVVSTQGAKESEVTAITILTGVEPILAARPKGDMDLGGWNLSMGGGED